MPDQHQAISARHIGRIQNTLFFFLGVAALGCISYIWVEPIAAQKPRAAAQAAPSQADNTASQTPQAPPTRPNATKQNTAFNYEEVRLDKLDNDSRVLMTIAGVFALLLGFGSWKTLEDQRRSAEKGLELQINHFKQQFEQSISEHTRKAEEALEDVRQLREEIHQDFPMFGRMRRNFGRILVQLQSACERLQPQDETYGRLTWEERERILFYERAIADSLLLDTRDFAGQLSEIYRLLGVFYGSRYSNCLVLKRPAQESDLDRARFYFDRAIQLNPQNYLAYSHAGHFTMFYENLDLARFSRDYLRHAAVIGLTKQKPWMNIALLELCAFRNPRASLAAIEKALECPEWELPGSAPKQFHCRYVRACTLAAEANATPVGEERLRLLEDAVASLETAATRADPWMRTVFVEGDFQTRPDREYFTTASAYPDLNRRLIAATSLIEAAREMP